MFFSELKQHDGSKETYLFNERRVLPQPGDGHCIVHSVRAALEKSGIPAIPNHAGLLEMLRFEIMNNGDFYKQFANEDDDMAHDLERYVRDQVYNGNTNDLVVYALANCLCVKIRLFELDEEEHCYRVYTEPIPPARRSGPARAEIDLLKTHEHYDALVAVNTGKSVENKLKISCNNGIICNIFGHLLHILMHILKKSVRALDFLCLFLLFWMLFAAVAMIRGYCCRCPRINCLANGS